MDFIFIAVGIFGLVGGSIFFLLAPKSGIEEETIQKRLQSIATRQAPSVARVRLLSVGDQTVWERLASFFLGEKELAAKYTKIKLTLHQAGYPGERAVRVFWGIRIFVTIAFAVGGFIFASFSQAPVSKMLLMIGGGAAVGYVLPEFKIKRKAKFRLREIQETLPDTLDLLVICVEAGLGIDSALVRVAKEQSEQKLALGDELQMMNQEVQAGMIRKEAMSRLAERIALDDLRGLVTFILQTEELGGSIARSLRVYSTTMRQKRSQRAEEAARKVVIKLIFPLVFFILPAVFLVVLGPAAINIVKTFATSAVTR
jgi:tight adherence protein C